MCGILVPALAGCSVFPDRVELPDAGTGAGGSAAWDASILSVTDAAGPCSIKTVVVRAVADTYLSSGYSDKNYGSNPEMLVGRAKSDDERLLVNFDLAAALATGFDVTAMRLVMTVVTTGSGQRELGLYPVTTPWTEAGATWVDAQAGSSWGLAGGDFSATPIATATLKRTASAGDAIEWPVPLQQARGTGGATSFVSDGSTVSFGWLVQSTDPSGDVPTVAFATREASSGAPRLELDVSSCE